MSDISQLHGEEQSTTSTQSSAEKGTPTLMLRQLSKGGDFIRSVQCDGGKINVIHGEAGNGLQPFRDALLGRNGPIPVSMRYGDRELLSSEVYAVGLAHYLWTENSVRDVLRIAGAPVGDIGPLLTSFGLEDCSELSPSSLGTDKIRRLAIACAFFSQAKVLLFDRPFAPITKNFCDRLALLLLDLVRDSTRIVVVTGLEKVPNSWKGSPLIRVENVDSLRKKTTGFTATLDSANVPPLSQVRGLLQANKQEAEEGEFFRTRPQIIRVPVVRVVVTEALKKEAIENPQLSALLAASAATTTHELDARDPDNDQVFIATKLETEKIETLQPQRRTTTIKKRGEKSLTRVSVIQKMSRHSFIYHVLIKRIRSIRRMFTKSLMLEPLPLEKRLTLSKKKERDRKTLVQSIVSVVIVILTIWCMSIWF